MRRPSLATNPTYIRLRDILLRLARAKRLRAARHIEAEARGQVENPPDKTH